MKKRLWVAAGVATVAACLYAMNASWLAAMPAGKPLLLAHRGVYQRYDHADLKRDTCTATRIFKPTNNYLENTLPSIKASLYAGADMVEVDVHPTTDDQFVVFHDWTVDCRTDGHGTTRDHTLAELKALDIGYGYTYDGGKTFPFRGKFKGQMPSLNEVLAAFPDTPFLINIKSNDPTEADKLIAYLKANNRLSPRLSVYGGARPIARMIQIAPSMRPFSTTTLKACGLTYLALGWSGYMPKVCHNTALFLPQNVTWLAWGYPNRLQQRFEKANSYIYLVGAHDLNTGTGPKDRVGLTGIDSPDQLAKVPKTWRMGILTNTIEETGPATQVRARHTP